MTVFWPVCMQISITKLRVIWIAQCKWWSGGVSKWRTCQITQRYRSMNALTSKLWFGGQSYMYNVTMWPSNYLFRKTVHFLIEILSQICQKNTEYEPYVFFLLWSTKPQTLRSLLSLVVTLGNSNMAITIRHCNFESAFMWKHSMFQVIKFLVWRGQWPIVARLNWILRQVVNLCRCKLSNLSSLSLNPVINWYGVHRAMALAEMLN